MKWRRNRRVWYLLLALLLCAAGAMGWAWTIVTPTIGEPYAVASSSSGAQAETQKLWSFGFVGDTHAGLGNSTVDELFGRFEAADHLLRLEGPEEGEVAQPIEVGHGA